MDIRIRPIAGDDLEWIAGLLEREWESTEIVSRGRIHYADELPGVIACHEQDLLGLVTYNVEDDECEIVTVNSLVEGVGIGTELLKAVMQVAIEQRCKRLWLVITNDNTDALRFYQTRGFVISAFHRNAVEGSRELKPEIPTVGLYGIPIRDEIELEMTFL
jgi:GNAT superfamily N-acetyltransferase